MANYTQEDIANGALEVLGIKAAGQGAYAEDLNLAKAKVATVHDMLNKERLVPFAISAVPEWAQDALIHLTAVKLITVFGITGERAASVREAARQGRHDLAVQVQAKRHHHPIEANYF